MRKILALLLLLPSLAHGAITLRFAGTPASAADGDVTPTLGGTADAGNLILCLARQRGSTNAPTSSGYTQLKVHGSFTLLGKIAAGGDADPLIDFTTGAGNQTVNAHCSVWAGALNTVTGILTDEAIDSEINEQNITTPALTVTVDNHLVLMMGGKDDDWTSVDTFSGMTELGEPSSGLGSDAGIVWDYVIQTTKANISAGAFTVTGGATGVTQSMAVSIKPAASAPTLSSVSVTDRTASSVTVGYTSDQAGTVYTARATVDQTAPTCDELEAQTYASAVSYVSEATSGGADSIAHTGLTNGTARDFYICVENAGGTDSAVTKLAYVYKQAAFSATPDVTATTDTTLTVSKTLDGAGTVHAVACPKDATAPTCDEVQAATCAAAASPLASANDDASGTMVLTLASARPVADVYVCGAYAGGTDSAVTTLADECLAAPTGKQIVNCPAGLTSIDAGSPIVTFNASVTPDAAVGDIPVVDLVTTPGGCDVTPTAAGLYSYPGSCGPSAQYHDWTFYDLSAEAMHADTMRVWTNNHAPQASVTAINLQVVEGAAVSTITYTDYVTDPDGQTVTCATQDTGTGTGEGKRPAGTTTTAGVFDGTYTTAASGSFGMLCTDPAGAGVTITTNWLVVAPAAIPQCVGATLTACLDLMSAAYIDVTASFECSLTVPALEVMSQDPASPTVVDPFTAASVVVSRGKCSGRRGATLGLSLGVN